MHTVETRGEDHRAPDEIIHLYSRAQALVDAELVDVSEMARAAGVAVPVAITRAAWLACVAWPGEAESKAPGQSEAGRLWDLLYVASIAASGRSGSRCWFPLYRVPVEGSSVHPRRADLVLQAHAGDEGESVISIMLPGED